MSRLDLFDSLTVKLSVNEVLPLSEIAVYTFQQYALFCWLVTHRQPTFSDGVTDSQVDDMIKNSEAGVTKLRDNGPASIYLVLRDAYTPEPQATERLILLALMAERPSMIPMIIKTFPETQDPLRLVAVLQPYTNRRLETVEDIKIPGTGVLQALASLGRVRRMQNLLLRDAVRVRYAMATIMADPHLFGTSSLTEVQAIVSGIENSIISNRALYQPLIGAIETLKINLSKVKGVLSIGAGITQDAIRRLRLLLGVLNTTDTLFDKMSTGLPSVPSPAKIMSIVAPRPIS